ncbi:type I pullulanase [Alkalihalobacillus sp. 1P02AB]|uniref:type I pullulanase n=1 Tax=Alkalihalobacillus sp. 1P02AB TaxID=3132260 RepID=UPI0039A5A925
MDQAKQQLISQTILKNVQLIDFFTIEAELEKYLEMEDINLLHIKSDTHQQLSFFIESIGANRLILKLEEPYILGQISYLQLNEDRAVIGIASTLVRTELFDQLYYYSGNDLGVHYLKEKTTVAVWAPTANAMNLLLTNDWNDDKYRIIPLIRTEKGVWRVTLEGDFECSFYQLEISINGEWRKANDPYAKMLTVNGQKAMIGDLRKTDPSDWPIYSHPVTNHDAIIYELHIRDFTIGRNNGIVAKGKYEGLMEKNTVTIQGIRSGLDYLKQLGITHVELLPVNDFGSVDEANWQKQYNWGYDPVHYFAPEGSYSTDPYHGYTRVSELKEMIATLHQNNLKVILDVVFNHVYIQELSDFEKLVPGYYFRISPNGQLSNGTGVGNDLATERKMVQKFIVDCVTYWLEEYDVDGFRFDLMGIIDIETMKQVAYKVKKRKPNALLLGEGWDLATAYPVEKRATLSQAKQIPELAFFEDHFRDVIKGSTFAIAAQGFIHGEQIDMQQLMSGVLGNPELFQLPQQAIHYVEAHDNHTLWDKLERSTKEENVIRMKRHRLASALVLLSQGVPFLHAGQEFFRTKYGDENSYNADDFINQFDWERCYEYRENVEFIKGLIAIRKAHGAFRLPTYKQIFEHIKWLKTSDGCLAFMLKEVEQYGEWKDIIVIFNVSMHKKQFSFDYGNWQVVVDEQAASLIPLYTFNGESLEVNPLSTVVCVKL